MTTYTWDGEDRLLSVTGPGGGITTLTYDATGLRHSAQTVAGTTKFVWDGQNVLLETDAGGTTQAAYTQSARGRAAYETADVYGALISQRRSGATQQYHFDALGSAMELNSAPGPRTPGDGERHVPRTDGPARVIWLSDSPRVSTGLGTVGRHVLLRLVRDWGHEVVCLGWYDRGDGLDASAVPYSIVPEPRANGAGSNLPRTVAHTPHDVVVTVGDPWNFAWVADAKTELGFTWVAYLTVCSRPLPLSAVSYLQRADAVAVASEFGVGVLADVLPGLHVSVIPYGVDSAVFQPLPDRGRLRSDNQLSDRFVVGFVGRNQPRKQIPVLVKAFARLRQAHPDAFLYLHTEASDGGWDVPALLERYSLTDCAGLTADWTAHAGLPDSAMNEVYNLFDVFVLPSMGEGFGLPILEAMATGVPVVTTDYSSNRDLVANRGELVEVCHFVTSTILNLELPLASEHDLTRRLLRLHDDAALRQSHREAGLAFSEGLTWDRCARAVHELIEGCAGRTGRGQALCH